MTDSRINKLMRHLRQVTFKRLIMHYIFRVHRKEEEAGEGEQEVAGTSGVVPFVPGHRQPAFTSSLLKSQRTMPMLLLVNARHVIQGAGRRVQEHGAGRAARRVVVARRLHGLDLEPVKTGPRLWYREILVVRALVHEER